MSVLDAGHRTLFGNHLGEVNTGVSKRKCTNYVQTQSGTLAAGAFNHLSKKMLGPAFKIRKSEDIIGELLVLN